MSEEPNWSVFYRRLRLLGPRMLKGVPKDYQEWVEETSVGTDMFWPGTQERFYTYWSWSKSPLDQRAAVVETLELWASNVKNELKYMSDIFEDSPSKLRALQAQIKKIQLKINDQYVDYMLAGAQSSIDADSEEQDDDIYPTDDIPVETVDFELLPAGSSEVNDTINELNERIRTSQHQDQVVDESRLAAIKTLKPDKCYIGSKKWSGYAVFEFLSNKKVILECPIEGNATYILTGDWREMVQHSKAYLRTTFPDRCERVFHQGEWLTRVRQALLAKTENGPDQP